MLSVIKSVPISTPITFPVRLSKLVFHPIALLLSAGRNTSLTVWSSETDDVSYEAVILLHRAFPGKLFFDLPKAQAMKLEHEIAHSEAVSEIFHRILKHRIEEAADRSRLTHKYLSFRGCQFASRFSAPK